MSAMLDANFLSSLGISGAPVLAADSKPKFDDGAKVYVKSEYTPQTYAGNSRYVQQCYTVVKSYPLMKNFPPLAFQDADGNQADSSTARKAVWFLELIPRGFNGTPIKQIHQDDCVDLADLQTLIGGDVASWADPA